MAGVVHGQEYVFDAASTARIGKDNLDAIRAGKMEAPSPAGIYTGSGPGAAVNDSNTKGSGGGVVVNLFEYKSKKAGTVTSRMEDQQQIIDVVVASIRNDEDVHDALSSGYGIQKVGR
ncbi:hypothetical protein D3C85_1450890 [compost metagenome]